MTGRLAESRPSVTAWGVALRRAAHQMLDRPLVLDDPIAIPILGLDAGELERAVRERESTPYGPAMRAFMAMRSRCAEDELAGAVARGTAQYVVLGAGLDTFAYRNPYPAEALRVFEVDHPATQAWKRQLVTAAGLAADGVTYVSVDFGREALAEKLFSAGFRSDAPAFFSWLGVTPYLTRDAIEATLSFIAGGAGGTGVVFDYWVSPRLLGPVQRAAVDMLAARVAAAGEPFVSFFEPEEIVTELRRIGFSSAQNLTGDILNARYFDDRADGLRVGSIAHLAVAHV